MKRLAAPRSSIQVWIAHNFAPLMPCSLSARDESSAASGRQDCENGVVPPGTFGVRGRGDPQPGPSLDRTRRRHGPKDQTGRTQLYAKSTPSDGSTLNTAAPAAAWSKQGELTEKIISAGPEILSLRGPLRAIAASAPRRARWAFCVAFRSKIFDGITDLLWQRTRANKKSRLHVR
jgi:hypothetical protein